MFGRSTQKIKATKKDSDIDGKWKVYDELTLLTIIFSV